VGQLDTWENPYVVVYYTGDENSLKVLNPVHGNWLPTPLKQPQRLYNELTGNQGQGGTVGVTGQHRKCKNVISAICMQ